MNKILGTISFFTMVLALLPRAGVAATVEEDLNALEQRRYEAADRRRLAGPGRDTGDELFYNTANGASLTKAPFVDLMNRVPRS